MLLFTISLDGSGAVKAKDICVAPYQIWFLSGHLFVREAYHATRHILAQYVPCGTDYILVTVGLTAIKVISLQLNK